VTVPLHAVVLTGVLPEKSAVMVWLHMSAA
jgi:hypothetical protein